MSNNQSKPQFIYNRRYKPNQLICGNGQTAVITGWTVKQFIAKRLNKDEFAVIGNLYSPTRGISPLIRNLLANPHVRFLVVINATKEDKNAGGCECLLDFFRYGFKEGKSDIGRNCWEIRSPITGYIDIEIESDALLKLRQSLQWQEAKSIPEAVNLVKSYASETLESWGEPLIFPQIEITPTVFPGPRYGHRIQGKTIAETWVKILHRIKTTGTIRPTQYGQWQELIDLIAIVTDEPFNFYFPEPNYLPIERQFLQDYIDQISNDSPQQEGIKYNYGQRLRSWFNECDQIEKVINKLVAEKDSSRAVMTLWDVQEDENNDSPPCLNHIWLRIVNEEISLTATFRSNDMFSAWPVNAMGLRGLQQLIRDKIVERATYNLKMGPLITVSQSAHIYDDTWENVDKLIANQYAKIINQRDYYDPSGNFLIELKEGKIIVKQTTSGSGEVVATYSSKNPLKLIREICAASPAIQPEHIGYLGIELQKAYESLKEGKQYLQDQ